MCGSNLAMARAVIVAILVLAPATGFAGPCEIYNDSGESLKLVRGKRQYALPPYSRLVVPAGPIEIRGDKGPDDLIDERKRCRSKLAVLDDLKITDVAPWFSAELRGRAVVVRAPKGAKVSVEGNTRGHSHVTTVGPKGAATIVLEPSDLTCAASKPGDIAVIHIEARLRDDSQTMRLGVHVDCDAAPTR